MHGMKNLKFPLPPPGASTSIRRERS